MDDPIQFILDECKVIAVVGLSSKAHRPSYGVAQYLQGVGYKIIPVNPNEEKVLGEQAYPSLEDIPVKVDAVCIFRRSEFVPPLVESAIAIAAKGVWMQEGVVHKEAASKARQAGLAVVMDRCMLKDHANRAA